MSLRPDSQIRISGSYRDFDFEVGYAHEIGYFALLKPKEKFGIRSIIVPEIEMNYWQDGKDEIPFVAMETEKLYSDLLQDIAIKGYKLTHDQGLLNAINKKLEQVYRKVESTKADRPKKI